MNKKIGIALGAFVAIIVLIFVFGAGSGGGSSSEMASNTYRMRMMSEPTTLHPITSTDLYATQVQGYVMEFLLTKDIETWEWKPSLAERWEISEDGKIFTFFLRQGVQWSDGQPFNADDVVFSFNVIMDPEQATAHIRPYLESIEKVEKVDDYTVRFYAKDVYFRNFSSVASGILTIVPRHIYENPKESENLNRTLVGTGPYMIDRYERGRRIVLAKNPNWWGNGSPDRVGDYNFERIIIRFVKEENIAIEMLQKTELDFLGLRPEDYVQKTTGPQWGRDVFKVKAENLAPKGYGFVGFNLENPLFKDKRVRIALSHLMNREAMNEQFRFGMSLLASGPWYQQSRYADPNVKPIEFNVARAIELLREAGWEDKRNSGILEKEIDGQNREFRFTLLLPNQDTEKYYTLYREDLKKAGVHMEIRIIEWNSFIKLLDERNFEAVTLAWSAGSADIEPKQVWHSDSRNGGSNFVGYNNPEVDRLIDQARRTLDDDEREPILRRVYKIIAEDSPYVFLFNDQYILYGHSKNISKEVDTYPYDVGTSKWMPVAAQ